MWTTSAAAAAAITVTATTATAAIHYSLHHGCANHATEGEARQSPIHCCDVTNPPYLFSGEL